MSTAPTALMIAADVDHRSAPLLRTEFTLDEGHGPVIAAEVLATALGVCEVTLNGNPVSNELLTPGWSSYEWRLRYAVWDITDHIQNDNVIGVLVGNGWHTGHLGFGGKKALYGPDRAALAEVRVRFADGHTQIVGTDATWKSGPSAVVEDDLYQGQTIDAGRADASWTRPGDELDGWSGVRVLDFDPARLTPYVGPPVVRQEEIRPHRIWTSPAGRTLVDFGQNLVGWIRLTVRGERGQSIVLRHAEVLENEELGTRPLRTARATDEYILSGGDDRFEPTLTFHGFQYAEIDGWTGTHDELSDAIVAVVIGSDMRRTGTFECSNALLNQLHSNIVWGMRGNFVDVPTDCPQRDERLGWTGDLAAFIDTATYLYDVDTFLRDWLLDLAVEQENAGGLIPVVVPDNLKYEEVDGLADAIAAGAGVPLIALWNDAACWVPWALWEAYGDRAVLEQQYDSMASHARRIAEALGPDGVIEGGIQLGDWLDPTAPPDAPYLGASDPYVVATACIYRSAVIAGDTAALLGRAADAREFTDLAERIRIAFSAQFVAGGRIRSDGAAVYALAIVFGLLDDAETQQAGDRLAELVADSGFHITTGFAGTPFISEALTRTGHLDTAYRLLMQTECPSWLYPVTMGATTVWERWDSMLPDGTINPGEMTSFNHYAFGAVGNWMHRTIGGISPLEPGYARVLIAPRPGGDLTWATASLETPQGVIAAHWEIVDGEFSLDVSVPDSATAVIRLPGGDDIAVSGGDHHFTTPAVRVLQEVAR